MNENDRQILMRFMERLEPDVEGREFAPPAGEMKERLENLLAGRCSETDRTALCEVLRGHPEWIQWVADRVKAARSGDPPTRQA